MQPVDKWAETEAVVHRSHLHEREVLKPMTVSMKVMSAGDGYKYLLKSVVAADGDRALSTPLTRYYVEVGTPPGRWLGRGLHAVGDGALSAGDPVTGVPGDPGFGKIHQGYLENSNVDAVKEITELISAQRAYEMNSKVIQTVDAMYGTVANNMR
mgnify:CR=1 FL=1